MKKEKITVIPMGNMYKVSYSLDVNDVVDAKVYDMSRSGMFPQMIPCDMQENGGVRTFEYAIEGMRPLPDILRTDMVRKDMLTVIYNVLEGLESFGKGMVSLSYVAKEIQYIFASPETYEVRFIVAPVDKEFTDMNEVRNLIKTIIVNARYSEVDGDNYVARLINYANMPGTFSSSDMKNLVMDLLMEMGAPVPVPAPGQDASAGNAGMQRGNSHILRSDAPSPKVSRLGVMRNNARMNGGMPPMGQGGMPMNGGMPPVGPNGMPMNGGMPPVGPNGMPMNGGMPPVGPNGMPMNGGMPPVGPNGMPMNGGMPPVGPNGMPMNGGMPPVGPNGMPMNGGMPPVGPNGMPMNGTMPPVGPNGMPMNGGMPPVGPNGMPMNGAMPPVEPNGMPVNGGMPPMGQPISEVPIPPMPEKENQSEKKSDMDLDNENPAAESVESPIAPEPPAAPEPSSAPEPLVEPEPPAAPEMSVPPMGNPFGGVPVPPVPPMGNPFGGVPVPPVPPMVNPDSLETEPMMEAEGAGATGDLKAQTAVPSGMPSSEGPAPYFVRTRTGEKINLDKAEFKIGHKGSDVDYVVSDNSAISRVHCVITKKNGVCFIRDNHSTNGTYINGDRLNEGEERFLTNNAIVILGNEEFVYHIR